MSIVVFLCVFFVVVAGILAAIGSYSLFEDLLKYKDNKNIDEPQFLEVKSKILKEIKSDFILTGIGVVLFVAFFQDISFLHDTTKIQLSQL